MFDNVDWLKKLNKIKRLIAMGTLCPGIFLLKCIVHAHDFTSQIILYLRLFVIIIIIRKNVVASFQAKYNFLVLDITSLRVGPFWPHFNCFEAGLRQIFAFRGIFISDTAFSKLNKGNFRFESFTFRFHDPTVLFSLSLCSNALNISFEYFRSKGILIKDYF